jgi:hypothetical protein
MSSTASARPRSGPSEVEDEGWLRGSVGSVSSWISTLGDTVGLSSLLPWLQAFGEEEGLEDIDEQSEDRPDDDHDKRRSSRSSEPRNPADQPSSKKIKSQSRVRGWLPFRRSTITSTKSRWSSSSTQSRHRQRRNGRGSQTSTTSANSGGLRHSVVLMPRGHARSSATASTGLHSVPRHSIHGNCGPHQRAPTAYIRPESPGTDGLLKMRRNGRRTRKLKERCVIS